MQLKSIREGTWKIYAVCEENGMCPLLEFMNQLNPKYTGAKDNVLATISKISQTPHGPRLLSTDICHFVDKDEKIWEFVGGDIRVLWFYSSKERMVIICCQAFIKKGRKTPKGEIQKAIQIKDRYEDHAKLGRISVIKS